MKELYRIFDKENERKDLFLTIYESRDSGINAFDTCILNLSNSTLDTELGSIIILFAL